MPPATVKDIWKNLFGRVHVKNQESPEVNQKIKLYSEAHNGYDSLIHYVKHHSDEMVAGTKPLAPLFLKIIQHLSEEQAEIASTTSNPNTLSA